MKVLNLYAGIGGNRKLWEDVEVTAVENNKEIAKIYQDFFPNDKVIVADAHKYLLEHYKEFDFIWSSPPCQSHSDIRRANVLNNGCKAIYPDLKLYEEIIFLETYFKGKFVVENVIGYYNPLRIPQVIDRHYFWANFIISKTRWAKKHIIRNIVSDDTIFGFNISKYKIDSDKRQILRNCVNPELALNIFKEAFKIQQKEISHY